MAFEIQRLYPRPSQQYPYNCRVTFAYIEDAFTARTWTEECEIPCTWVGSVLYITDRYTDFLALRYANATYN